MLPLPLSVARGLAGALLLVCAVLGRADERPNIVLVMSDDQGWGQTGYNHHPLLKTPHLDAMAAAGIRFNRFYAGASNCSPTRATLLTGRSNDRTGVQTHGYPLRRQEKTIAQALKGVGYATGHFGKWHLNGLRGPGAPIFADDPLHPGVFGFDTWVSVTNFFDLHPIMSRNGSFEEFAGDSSEVAVAEALKWMRDEKDRPFFSVIWFGTPHSPFRSFPADEAGFEHLPDDERRQAAELVAMDRAMGTLRAGLREMGEADNTILWFNGDNGGLALAGSQGVGGLRGFKNQVYEGGIRVPGLVEWPAGIAAGQVTDYPAVTMDIFPTIGEVVGLDESVYVQPLDGHSLVSVFNGYDGSRDRPIPFKRMEGAAIIDGDWKLVMPDLETGVFELYNLAIDPTETKELTEKYPAQAKRMRGLWDAFNRSREASVAVGDYPEGRVLPDPAGREDGVFWIELPEYQAYFKTWEDRPEYKTWVERGRKQMEKK
ncbi:MAG: sulfatase-like hydrolase/transferase [Synoicihabitans sp.]